MPQTFGMRSVTMRVKRILLKLVEDMPPNFPHSQNEQITGFQHTKRLDYHLC
jgi:hypothetical protein